MKFQDSSFNSLKVTVGTKSVTHARTHALRDAPKAICPINFFKVGGIMSCAVTAQLICAFIFAYMQKSRFSHDGAHKQLLQDSTACIYHTFPIKLSTYR